MASLKRKILKKTRILHKGLIIVLLPLLLNIGLVVLLNNSLDRAAQWMDRSRQTSYMITGLSQCLFATTGILTMGVNVMMAGYQPPPAPPVFDLLNELETHLSNLKAHASPEIGYQLLRSEIKSLADQQRTFFAKTNNPQSINDPLLVKIRRVKTWTEASSQEGALLQRALLQCQSTFLATTKMEQDWQRKIEIIVTSGLAFNFILACALAYFFHRNISTRIDLLVRNARKVPKNEAMTERVRGHDELADLGLALHSVSEEISDSVEYRRTLMQMMAHDLRSPLTSSKVSLEIFERFKQEQLSVADKKEVAEIKNSLDTCLNLINDLLLLESLETGESNLNLQQENMREVVASAISEVQELAASRQVMLSNQSAQEYLEFDRDNILIVLKKLLSNAIKESPPGAEVVVSSTNHGPMIRVGVQDQGHEMEAETKDSIFDKFYHFTPTATQGEMKLGLAICKQIVSAHHGRIGVEATPVRGATFWFELKRSLAGEPTADG